MLSCHTQYSENKMNLFHEAKKVLDKDGKVNPLGPYGKQKLTGREISTYFRRNKITDPEIKKAVEVALDLGGAFDIAGKEIQKFYGRAVRNSKEVKNALVYANESFQVEDKNHPCQGLSEDDPCWKDYEQIGMKKKNGKKVPNCVPKEETISEAKNLMPEVQKIVDTKGAAKVGGVMLDMFTASVLTQAYAKVSDANKKKMESSNIQTLVKLAQRVMGMKESLDEEVIVYKVKGIQKPETEKFESSAKLMKLKVSFKKKGSDTLVTMTGNKKQLRDFDSVARGKSSYGDPSSVQHFDEK